MLEQYSYKDWSNDKISTFLVWGIVGLSVISLLSTFLLVLLSYPQNIIFFSGGIFRILLLTFLLYFLFKKKIWVFYVLSLLSFKSIISSLKESTTQSDVWFLIDVALYLYVFIASLTIIVRNKVNKGKFFTTFHNLNKKEVVFWGPLTFIALGILCIVMLYATFFLPFGLVDGKEKTLAELSFTYFSLFPLLTLLTILFSFVSIYQKSYLKAYISSLLLVIFLLFTLATYQDIVGKPYSIADNLFLYTFIGLLIIFIIGLFILWSAFMNKDYFKLSKY